MGVEGWEAMYVTERNALGGRHGFLSLLADPEIGDLAEAGRIRRYRRGATLLAEGSWSGLVIVLHSGRVKVSSVTERGDEVLLAVRSPGDLLGEFSALDGEPCSATVTALDPVEALVVGAAEFRVFLEAHPAVTLHLLELLTRRLRDADRKRVEFGAADTTGRVSSRLVELADRFGQPTQHGVRISVPLTQEELAGWVGSSREAVSKALRALRTRGWIETQRKAIVVVDLAALRRRAT
ncbi:MAG TPA: Crp/Fnr family transcriptional regulator [Actinomycetes bacterium]